MKRVWILMVLFLVCSVVFAAVDSRNIVLTSLFGKVDVNSGDGNWDSAKKDLVLDVSYFLRTGVDAYAELKKGEGNSFRIKENTEIQITDIEKEIEKNGSIMRLTKIDLLDGSIIAKLDNLKAEDEVRVRAPIAVAGARGTGFVVSYMEKECEVSVLDSQVDVVSSRDVDKSIVLNEMEKTVVVPWDEYTFEAVGTGVLSEKILKDKIPAPANRSIVMGQGKGSDYEQAERNAFITLADQVFSLPVSDSETVSDILDGNKVLYGQLYSAIATAEVSEKESLGDGVFSVIVVLDVSIVEQIIGISIVKVTSRREEISLDEYGKLFGALARVTTIRAAQLDAYRRIAEHIYGTVISSSTVLEDLAASEDVIVTTVEGIVKGAEITDTYYYSDGSVSVVMRLNALLAKDALVNVTGDIYGQDYMSSAVGVSISEYLEYNE